MLICLVFKLTIPSAAEIRLESGSTVANAKLCPLASGAVIVTSVRGIFLQT